jgi:hypothetical protein
MERDDEDFLKAFYQAVADRPLEADDPAYVPLHKDANPVEMLARGIEWGGEQSVQLLSVQRGAGKTTELRRLRRRLEDAGYFVVLCDLEGYLNQSTPADGPEFVIAVAEAFNDKARVRLGENQRPKEFWADVQKESSFRTIQYFWQKAIPHIRREEPLTKGIVLLVDSVEPFRDTMSNIPEVHISAERIFVAHAPGLGIPEAHVIYTIPPFLPLINPDLGSLYSPGGLRFLSAVKIYDKAGRENRSGLDILTRVVESRGDWRRLLGERQVLDTLIKSSDGLIGNLLRLLAEVMRRTDRLPASQETLAAVLADMPSSTPQETWTPAEDAEGEEWFAYQREAAGPTPAQANVLVLENVCAFEHLRLELSSREGEGQWAVFLGDNGVGKSTVLRALALAAIEPAMATSLLELRSSTAPFVRGGLQAGKVELELSTGSFAVELQKSSLGFEGMRGRIRNGAVRPPVFAYGCQRGTALGDRTAASTTGRSTACSLSSIPTRI